MTRILLDTNVILDIALERMTDFEDAVQSSAASHEQVDYLITRNKTDFRASYVSALSPGEFLTWWQQQK